MLRALVLAFLLIQTAHAAPRRPVVVISIDGLRGHTLSSLPQRHLQTPNLTEFVNSGAVASGLVGVFPTVTYPSHTTLVTGVSPDRHGILGNTMFDPEHKTNGAWYWYAQQIQRPTLWDLAHTAHLTTAAVSWPVTVGATIDNNFPEYRQYDNEDLLPLYRALCTPGLAADFEHSYGPLTVTSENDETRGNMAVFLLKNRHPDLLLVHLIDMDHQQHVHGPDSPEAFTALEHIDAVIGRIRAAAPAGTVFVVVSDHGFLPVTQALQPTAVLTSLGLSATTGHPETWRVAAFANGSSFGLILHDPKDTAAKELATKTFQQLQRDGAWGIDTVLSGDALKQAGGYGNSFLAVGLKSGYMLGGANSGPWLTPSGTKGMHGFLPGNPMLEAAFVAFGPGIGKRQLGQHRLVDVAPTVSALMDVPAKDMEGSNLLVP